MESNESFTPAIFFKKTASEDRSKNPVSIGFITPISNPECLKEATRPAATMVFPTPVSVPVMKRPREERFFLKLCPLQNMAKS
jgi:hypothetical protein